MCPTASSVAWAVQVARALTGVVGTYTVAVYMCDGTIYMVAGFGDFVTKASIAQTEAQRELQVRQALLLASTVYELTSLCALYT